MPAAAGLAGRIAAEGAAAHGRVGAVVAGDPAAVIPGIAGEGGTTDRQVAVVVHDPAGVGG